MGYRSFHFSKIITYLQSAVGLKKDIIHSDLDKKQKQKMCSCAFEATSQKLLHVTEVSATMTPPLPLLIVQLLLAPRLLCPILLSSGCLCSVFETGIGEGLCRSSGMEDGSWHAASCFDGSRLPLHWQDEAGTSRPRSCQKNYPSSHLSMHGVPPGGKIQLLHMAEEEEDYNEWKEQEVELRKRTMELFALF